MNQIAGDKLADPEGRSPNADGLIATTVLAIGAWDNGDADKDKVVSDIVDDQINVVGQAFLGLTLACARCHDHKFDPISTKDYYALAGMFYSSHVLANVGTKGDHTVILRLPLASPDFLARRQKQLDRLAELKTEMERLKRGSTSNGKASPRCAAGAGRPKVAAVAKSANGQKSALRPARGRTQCAGAARSFPPREVIGHSGRRNAWRDFHWHPGRSGSYPRQLHAVGRARSPPPSRIFCRQEPGSYPPWERPVGACAVGRQPGEPADGSRVRQPRLAVRISGRGLSARRTTSASSASGRLIRSYWIGSRTSSSGRAGRSRPCID